MTRLLSHLKSPSLLALLSVLAFSASAMAGSLAPSANPASTMRTLAEIYNAIVGTFDSSGITANQNGSLIETLKYIENQTAWASSSNNIWSLNSGNVGIGTSSLETKFEVSGTASVSSLLIAGSVPRLVTSNSLDFDELAASMTLDTNTTIANNGYALTLGNASVSGTFEVGSSGFWTNGTNVGVGTSAPVYKLDVIAATSGASGYSTRFVDNNATNGAVFVFGYTGASADSKYKALIVDSNGFHLGKLTDALNAAPTYGLSVLTSGGVQLGGNYRLYGQNTSQGYLEISNTNGIDLQWTNYVKFTGDVNGAHIFTANNTTPVERITINTSGNVGIGDTSPTTTLDVTGNASISGNFELGSNGFFWNGTNVGIGTSRPDAKLEVNGTASISNSLYVTSGGLVGVGVVAPGAMLDITNVGGAGGNELNFSGASTANIYQSGASQALYMTTNGGVLCFGVSANGCTLGVNASGNTVITTQLQASTTSALVYDATNSATHTIQQVINNTTNTTGANSLIQFYTGGASANNKFGVVQNASGGNDFVFNTYSGGFGERLRITSDGNVGIGDTSPTTTLDVAGSASVSGTFEVQKNTATTTDNAIVLSNTTAGGGTGLMMYNRAGAFDRSSFRIFSSFTDGSTYASGRTILQTIDPSGNSVDALTLDTPAAGSYGNVGINITTPGAVLEVKGSATDLAALTLSNAGNMADDRTTLLFQSTAYNIGAAIKFRLISGATQSNLEFHTTTGSALGQKAVLTGAGNFGIGQLAPSQKLSVAGNILASSSGNVDFTLRSSTTNGAANNDDAQFTLRTGSASERFDIINGAGAKLFSIASAGNVGIRNSTPTTTLDVTGNASISGNFELGSNGFFWNGTNVGIGTSRPDAKLEVNGTASISNSLYVISGGNVGIGTSAPVFPLDVNGDIGLRSGGQIDFADEEADKIYYYSTNYGTGVSANDLVTWSDSGFSWRNDSRTGNVLARLGQNSDNPIFEVRSPLTSGTSNYARLGLAPHSSYNATDDPYIEGYNVGNDGGLAFGTYNGGVGERMRITPAGNVGIGTTSVDAKFEVAGTASISNSLYVISGGNVGIGTNAPTTKLHISVDDATTNAVTDILHLQHFTTGTVANNIGAGILFSSEDTIGQTESIARISGILTNANHGSETGALTFALRDSERMRIAQDGTVGIGTTVTGAAGLAVRTTVVDGLSVIASGNAGGGNGYGFYLEKSGTGTNYGIYASISGTTSLAALLKSTDSNTTSVTEVLRLIHDSNIAGGHGNGASMVFYGEDTNATHEVAATIAGFMTSATHGAESGGLLLTPRGIGNVGIGTSYSPDAKLDVAGNVLASASGNVDLILNATNATNGTEGLFRLRSASTTEAIQILNGSSAVLFSLASVSTNTGGSYINAGNFGIGDTSPTTTLDVSGSASISSIFEVGTSGLWANGTNVGIGTNTPKGKLTVAGTSAEIIASGSTNPAIVINATNATNGTQGLFKIQGQSTSELLSFVNGAGTYLMTIASAGNVGIGTTAPTAKMHLYGGSDFTNSTMLVLQNPGANYGTGNCIDFRTSVNGVTNPSRMCSTHNGAYSNDFTWWTGTNLYNAPQQKMFLGGNGRLSVNAGSTPTTMVEIMGSASVDPFHVMSSLSATLFKVGKTGTITFGSSANIGIGTNTPAVQLQVTKSSNGAEVEGLRIQNTGSSYGSNTSIGFISTTNGLVYPARIATEINGGYGLDFVFYTGSYLTSGAGQDKFRIVKNGLVGVNISAPATMLDVKGSAAFDPFNVASVSGTSFLRVTKGGNVGIGTTTPTSKLQIVGGDCADQAGGGGCTADYAELYPSTEDMQKGDLVMIDTATTSYAVKKATSAGVAIGIVSSNPAITIDGGSLSLFSNAYVLNPRKPAIALKGRVPLKVIGTIAPGDWLTVSDTPGYAQKATAPGMVVGVALEASHDGTVLTFVSPTWWSPSTQGESVVSLDAPTMSSIFSAMIQMFTDLFHITFSDGLIKTQSVQLETGATIKDRATGQPYCVQVEYGQLVTTSGECGALGTPTPTPSVTPEATPATTPEVTPTPEATPTPSPTPESTPEVTPVPTTTPEVTLTPEATPPMSP